VGILYTFFRGRTNLTGPITEPVTFTLIFQIVSSAVGALGLLFGGGLFKAYLNHSRDMAVQEHDLKLVKASVTEQGLKLEQHTIAIALHNQTIQTLLDTVKKLDDLPKILASLQVLEERMTGLQKSLDTETTRRTLANHGERK